ncbi:MAG: HAMP domain-containing histidine kinase, partial [bacterium]|nr:HAMP domain-containing histidine kinase [bacterium]
KFSREQLKQLNATKDKFFSIMAHDLKDPLQFLLLSADSLYNNYDSFDENKRKDYIRRFYNNSQQISELLENLLQWSRSQQGLITVKPEKLNIAALVEECFRLLHENAAKKDISLTSRVDAGIFANADKNMIRTVLRNLVSNGIKFTHTGGEVVAEASVPEQGNRVEVTVTDDGVGMTQEDINGLFRIEVKRTTRGTAKEAGTGLGLILCKEFIEENNGSISVASEPDKGSGFTFTLPQ